MNIDNEVRFGGKPRQSSSTLLTSILTSEACDVIWTFLLSSLFIFYSKNRFDKYEENKGLCRNLIKQVIENLHT